MNKKTFVNYKQKNYFKYFSTICCFLIFLICCLSLFNIDKSSTNHLGLIKNEQTNTSCTNTNLLLTSTTTKQGAEAIDEARKCVVDGRCWSSNWAK